MPTPAPPYLGAAYYPEDWPLSQVDADVELMVRAGMNVMRVGEFAWHSMEPEEGWYQFDWLHMVVEKLGAAGIAVILGTPTATPPIWLVERYPEVLFVTDEGKQLAHGARRHVCPNNLVYRDYCARIVTKMAEEFGDDDRVIGWQIDNEVYPLGGWPPRSCCCPICVRQFQAWMRDQFGTIDRLNGAWCLHLWSQAYRSFDQLPPPRRDIWHHPSLLAAWAHFSSDSYAGYVKHQADILHEKAKQPVGTDMMPFDGVDYADMHRCLDLVQFNHYNEMDNLWRAAFWFDFIRPLKPAPFWNTETQTSWNGSVAINSGLKDPGFCRANSWLPIAMGGEANLYWLWRQHWAGQELMHGAVVSSAGRPLHVFPEVQEIAAGLATSSEFLRGTRPVQAHLALLYSQRVARVQTFQPIMPGLSYQSKVQESIYRPMLQAQLRPDIISPEADLSEYRVIVAPLLLSLDEADLRSRLREWVEAGGILVIGPMSDIRDGQGAKFTHAPLGSLEEWTGVYCRHTVPGVPKDLKLRWDDGHESAGSLWFDAFEPNEAQVLATYLDWPNEGLAAVTSSSLGNGKIVLLGTLPPPEDLQSLLRRVCDEAGTPPVIEASANLIVVPRVGAAGWGIVAVEVDNEPATLNLPGPMDDLITGQTLQGRLELPPYSVLVLRA